MQSIDWKVECRNLFFLLVLAGFVGWLFQLLPWALFIASSIYIGWTIFQLRRIQKWLSQKDDNNPPESRGLWGAVFDGIYHLQRQSQEERVRLQAAVDYLQDSFASLDDATVMIDAQGNIEWSNEAAEKLLGLRYPDDKNQLLINLIRAPEFIRYFEGDDYVGSLQIPSPHNSNYHLLINITYFGQGSRLLFARDVTENDRLQEMRKDFVANVSHELRTPLTVINGYLETLSDYSVADGGDEKRGGGDELRWRRAIDQMLNQSHRMETLIKDLIVLSRLESVPESESGAQDAIELRPILEMVREEVLAAVKGERDIRIECDDRLRLLGNNNELHSAIANLVMNAAKYTQDKGRILIRWHCDQQHAYLSVEDNGEGIDSYHLPRLTERFYRVDKSRSVDTGGTGLGLAIVKHILLRHQAELQVSSVLGEGSTFSCVFPRLRVVPQSDIA